MKLAVLSTMTGLPWGASELLWSEAVQRLVERGHEVVVEVDGGSGRSAHWKALSDRGVRIRRRSMGRRIKRPRGGTRRWLCRESPDLALISFGAHLDDPAPALACRAAAIPYALLLHSVHPGRWVEQPELSRFRQAWTGSRRAFFVSRENRRLLEFQLAVDLPSSCIVANPLAVAPDRPLSWPEHPAGELHLACVGRLGCWQKGQDLILEVLSRDRWRKRELTVTFWGRDHGNRKQLEDLARWRGLGSAVRFAGHTATPIDIWRESHGLLLPSRYEGMPMVTAEAMLCGRVPVVTQCGRNGDWIEDGVTGFLAPAATVELLDATLERAWARRRDWPVIGRTASDRVRRTYDPDPAATFASELEALAEEG